MKESFWDKLKRDIKQRFMTFETAKGIYLVPAGGVIIYITVFHLQFIIQAFGVAIGGYMVFEGIRKILVNRVKQKAVRDSLVKEEIESRGTFPG